MLPIARRGLFGRTKQVGERLTGSVMNFGCFVIVGEQYATMVHRFQKFQKQLQPGVNFIIPFIDQVAYVHDLREQVIDITSQVAVTKDNVALHIDGVLYIKINDPYKASYGVEDYLFAVSQLAQTTMRSEIGKLTLDTLFEERESLNAKIVQAIEKDSEDWGITALRYEIKDIEPPSNISNAMIL